MFRTAAGERYVITGSDLDWGGDHLQINWAQRIKIVAAGEDCEIHFGPNVVGLQGVAADGLSSLDFL